MNNNHKTEIDDLLVGINLANYESLDKILVKTEHLVTLRAEILALRSYIKDQDKDLARLKVDKNNLIAEGLRRPRYQSMDEMVIKGKLYA